MQQLSSIPKFQGDESSQDAEEWLETLVDCTEGLSDAAILRRITTKFPSGSPAREWFDNMDDSFKEKWATFEKQFRSQWITQTQRRAKQEVAWSIFTNHTLNIDEFLGHETDSYDNLDHKVAIWVEEHIHLGKATDRDDDALIAATLQHIPPFISAYLQIHFKPPYGSFDAYCKNICEMPVKYLDMERIRRQMSAVDWASSIERKVDEISELVKQMEVKKCNCGDTGAPSQGSSSDNLKTGASIDKGVVLSSISKNELIVITQRAISLFTSAELGIDQMLVLRSTIVTYDGLTGGQRNKDKIISSSFMVGQEDNYFVAALYQISCYMIHKEKRYLDGCASAWKFIVSEELLEKRTKRMIILPSQRRVTVGADSSARQLQLHTQLSGPPTMVGGAFGVQFVNDDTSISPLRTLSFVVATSYFAECTGEEKYKEYALRSAHCVKTWMLDAGTSLVKDCQIDALTAKEKSPALPSCHVSGMAIEAFSVLASVTQDESWRSLAINIATAAMHYKEWHDSNGILMVGCDENAHVNSDVRAFKGLLNRGLLVAYQRNRSNEDFCNLVRNYINVQCNALLNLARFDDYYGVDWRGPPPTSPAEAYPHAQMAAIHTLVAAIGVHED